MAYLVDEWYEYHRRVGFDHLIIYDNNSTDGLGMLFANRADLEIIRWPWRRSQHQAYTHALLSTRDRCVWTLFSDLDVFIFPRSSNSVRSVIQNQASSDIAQISFKLLRMSHENLVECSNTSITETYIHRKRLPDAWDKNPSTAVITSLAVPMHRIHEAQLLKPYKSIILSSDIAYGVHYSDRCWKQYFFQKIIGRTGIKDWIVPRTVSILHPIQDEYTLDIVGFGSVEDVLKLYIKEKQIKNIQFIGRIDYTNLYKYYQSAQAFICTNLNETYGFTLLESLSCGTPIIYPKCPVFEKLYKPYFPQLEYDINNNKEFINALKYIQKNDKNLRQLCRAHACQYSWKKATEELVSLYQNIVANHETKIF
ncbi:unnamed protein product [Rotaria sp. Silwood1]|nr:unnamed protein product [Rotaria sp. Silwood1]